MKFTTKHDQIIIKAVKKKPYNLQEAFRDAALEIGMVFPEGIQKRYYSTIRKQVTVFTMVSDSFYGVNIKSFNASKHIKVTQSDTGIQYMIPFNK